MATFSHLLLGLYVCKWTTFCISTVWISQKSAMFYYVKFTLYYFLYEEEYIARFLYLQFFLSLTHENLSADLSFLWCVTLCQHFFVQIVMFVFFFWKSVKCLFCLWCSIFNDFRIRIEVCIYSKSNYSFVNLWGIHSCPTCT